MPTVRVRDAAEYPEAAQRLFELSKQWFGYEFKQPPAMSTSAPPFTWASCSGWA